MIIKEEYFEKDRVFALIISVYPLRDKFNLTAVAESGDRLMQSGDRLIKCERRLMQCERRCDKCSFFCVILVLILCNVLITIQ